MKGGPGPTPHPSRLPEEAGHGDVETDSVQHPKAKGIVKEIRRTGPGLGVAERASQKMRGSSWG